jgi:hypothetical protein
MREALAVAETCPCSAPPASGLAERGVRRRTRIALAERMTDIANEEQSGPQYDTYEIDVVTDAAPSSPAHQRVAD